MAKELKKIKHLRRSLRIALGVFLVCAAFCAANAGAAGNVLRAAGGGAGLAPRDAVFCAALFLSLAALARFLLLYAVHVKRGFVSLWVSGSAGAVLFLTAAFFLLDGFLCRPLAARLTAEERERLAASAAAAAPFFPVRPADVYKDGAYDRDAAVRAAAALRRLVRGGVTGGSAALGAAEPPGDGAPYILRPVAEAGGAAQARTLSAADIGALSAGETLSYEAVRNGTRLYCAAAPLFDGAGTLAGVLELARDARGVEDAEKRARKAARKALAAACLALALAAALGLLKTALALRGIARAMKAVCLGAYETRLEETGRGEAARLRRYANRLAAALEAKRNAEAASQAERSFAAMLSHEIRTPLNAIIGLSEIETQNPRLDGDAKLNIQKIYTAGRGLLEMVNDILDVSKIEAGAFDIVECEYSLPALISEAAEINKFRLKNKPVRFEIALDPEIPLLLYGDDTRLKQVLNNLLSNAFKYTRQGAVALRVGWEKKKIRLNEAFGVESSAEIELNTEGVLCIGVEDTGIGIKEEDREKIFEKYGQADLKKNKNIEGTGLGLAITRRIVGLMRGDIKLFSVYGEGSRFDIRLPQRVSGAERVGEERARQVASGRFIAAPAAPETPPAARCAKVLVADDVETNLDVAAGLLKVRRIVADRARNGAEAVALVRESRAPGAAPYDIVFLDHLMRPADGEETARAIRALDDSEYIKNLPLIVMTGNDRREYDGLIRDGVFSGYLAKPVEAAALDELLRRFTRGAPPAPEPAEGEGGGDGAALPPPPPFEAPPFPAGLDGEKGAAYFGSFDIYIDMLRSFVKSARAALDALDDIYARGHADGGLDLALFTVHIHGLKGAAFGVFARDIGNDAGALERKAKEGDLAFVLRQAGAFLKRARLLTGDIEAYARDYAGARNAARPKRDVVPAPVLDSLVTACDALDMDGIDRAMGELQRYEYEHGAELAAWLVEKIKDSAFDDIVRRLRPL